MAHEVDMTTGRAAMAYAGETPPWHGLGFSVSPEADLDTWVREAGLDWTMLSSPVLYRAKIGDEDESTSPIFDLKNRVVLYRSDTLASVSVVSDRYRVVQPRDVAEFFREFTEVAGFTMETMGALRGGAYYWGLARIGKGFNFSNSRKDVVNPYVLLATSADGSMSTVAHLTSVRVVCMNTLQLSVGAGGGKAMIQVPHRKHFDPDEVKSELGLLPEWWETYRAEARAQSRRAVTREEAVSYFVDVFAPGLAEKAGISSGSELLEVYDDPEWELDPEDRDDKALVSIARLRPRVTATMQAFDSAPGSDLVTAKGTAWGLTNAVTRYWDHGYKAREADTRLLVSWFYEGGRDKRRAHELATTMSQ